MTGVAGPDDLGPDGGGEYARDASSLNAIVAGCEADGYVEQMIAVEGGEVRCGHCQQTSPIADFEHRHLRRVEGASDPGDMSAVVPLTCPKCGTKGTLVVMYGPEASAADADVLAGLQ